MGLGNNLATDAPTKEAVWTGDDKPIGSVANASGALTNNGSGAVGYYNNFVPDARTVTIAGTANQVTSSAGAQDLTANRTWTLSVPSVFTAPGTIAAVTGMTNQSLTTPGVMTNDDKGKLLSTPTLPNALLANSSITIQGSAVALGGTTLAVGSAPVFDLSSSSNLLYKYTTNIVGAANFVFGKAYWTNASANFTFPALTIDPTMMETLAVFVTNSGAATITATINGVAGAPGHVVPAVFFCTNATVTEIDVTHFGVQWTNACVSKN